MYGALPFMICSSVFSPLNWDCTSYKASLHHSNHSHWSPEVLCARMLCPWDKMGARNTSLKNQLRDAMQAVIWDKCCKISCQNFTSEIRKNTVLLLIF